MIDPKTLIDPTQSGMPAPVSFVQFFKALGFTLHTVPMNLWYAGLLIALVLHLRGSEPGRRFAGRLLQQMPIIVAFGINFGIVPLLFMQLAYYKVFYPATILMACFWLAIIVLLIPAYYGVYAYALGLSNSGDYPVSRRGKNGTVSLGAASGTGMAGWRRAAGWVSALLFICIGFTFANGMSLMEHVPRWLELWNAYSTAAAATGTALNVGDPTLWPRWLLMFGLGSARPRFGCWSTRSSSSGVLVVQASRLPKEAEPSRRPEQARRLHHNLAARPTKPTKPGRGDSPAGSTASLCSGPRPRGRGTSSTPGRPISATRCFNGR